MALKSAGMSVKTDAYFDDERARTPNTPKDSSGFLSTRNQVANWICNLQLAHRYTNPKSTLRFALVFINLLFARRHFYQLLCDNQNKSPSFSLLTGKKLTNKTRIENVIKVYIVEGSRRDVHLGRNKYELKCLN